MDVIISYRQREEKMQDNINQFKKDIVQLSTDVIYWVIMQNLVLRQLNDGQNMEMKNMEALGAAAVGLLNKKINQLQDKLAFYEKTHKQYDKVSGFVIKNREIVSPQ